LLQSSTKALTPAQNRAHFSPAEQARTVSLCKSSLQSRPHLPETAHTSNWLLKLTSCSFAKALSNNDQQRRSHLPEPARTSHWLRKVATFPFAASHGINARICLKPRAPRAGCTVFRCL